jgi:hypothetical protein
MYVLLTKALYGTLHAALLFWKDLSTYLKGEGFVINPYDWCVANKMIDGKQCTIVWHVNDLKISHVSADAVTGVIKGLQEKYGKEAPLTINRGKIHEYLGITLDYSIKGKVRITMYDYIDDVLEEVPADMKGVAATPAANHLFTVNEKCDKLDEETAETFHHLTAKLMFLCKRARPDIHMAVAFLSTRVKSPDLDDWKKLARTIRYLRRTKCRDLCLEADRLDVKKWWVDGSFAVHPDMKSYTGGYFFLKGLE